MLVVFEGECLVRVHLLTSLFLLVSTPLIQVVEVLNHQLTVFIVIAPITRLFLHHVGVVEVLLTREVRLRRHRTASRAYPLHVLLGYLLLVLTLSSA